MKKLLTIILVLCSVASFGQMRGGAQYDPGAARKNLSNVDASATPSMTSITLSDKVQAAWANILGDVYASGAVKVAPGTAAAPAYTFSTDPDTGIYRSAENTLALTASGAVGLYTSGGNVAIGDVVSPNYKLRVINTATNTSCFYSFFEPPLLSGTAAKYYSGIQVSTTKHDIPAGISNTGYLRGLTLDSFISDTNFQGTLANQYGAYIRTGINVGTGTVTNAYGIYLGHLTTTGTITNAWGLYQDSAIARNYFAGRTLFGTTTDDGVSAVQVAGGGLRLVGSTAPATPAEGTMYFNSTDKHFYGWNGTGWVQLDN